MDGGQGRAYRMSLSDYYRYLTDKRAELDACRRETEEIQAKFRQVFDDELQLWQALFSFCLPRVQEQRARLPADLTAYLDRIEAEERVRISNEIEALDKEVADKRQQVDAFTAEAKGATRALREANPELNAREEELKARVARLQDAFTLAYEREDALDNGLFGGLVHAVQIGRLRREQRRIKAQQAEALKALRDVRRNWVDTVQATSETQAKLRDDWQKTSIRLAQATAERDYKRQRLPELAAEAGLQRALLEIDFQTSLPGELGDKLRELARRNIVRRAYEVGLRSVAEALGLLKGMSDGLGRFAESVAKVVAEQRRYNLKDVPVAVPERVARINAIWGELRQKVKNEDYMGSNPLEFSAVVKRYISDPLTNDVVKDYFESQGEALNQATKAWA